VSEKTDFQLITALPVQACVDRLRNVTDEKLFRLFGRSDREVMGSVKETGFVWRKKLKGKNSFQLLLHGRFAPHGSGTRIDCRAAMAKSVKVFMAFWFAMVVTFCFFVLFEEVPVQLEGDAVDIGNFVVFVPFGMLIFGVLLVWVGRFLARDDSAFMRDLICRTLDAEIVEQKIPGKKRAEGLRPTPGRTIQR
jgi:hypothetical protein